MRVHTYLRVLAGVAIVLLWVTAVSAAPAEPAEPPSAETAPGEPAAEQPAPPPATDTAPPEHELIEISVSYGFEVHSSQTPLIHEVRGAVTLVLADWARPFAAYRAIFPFEASNRHGKIEVTPHPIEIGWSAAWQLDRFRLGAGAAFVADRITWSVEALGDELAELSTHARWMLALSPFVEAGWAPAEAARLFVAVGGDLLLNEWTLVVESTEGTHTLVDPHRFQPHVHVGFEFAFL